MPVIGLIWLSVTDFSYCVLTHTKWWDIFYKSSSIRLSQSSLRTSICCLWQWNYIGLSNKCLYLTFDHTTLYSMTSWWRHSYPDHIMGLRQCMTNNTVWELTTNQVWVGPTLIKFKCQSNLIQWHILEIYMKLIYT